MLKASKSMSFKEKKGDKNLYINVHGNIIHNSAKAETTQMSINWELKNRTC